MEPAHLWAFLPLGYLLTIAVETPVLLLFLARRHTYTTRLVAGVWLTACIGIVCGAGNWRLLIVAVLLLFILLMLGGKLERLFHTRSMSDEDSTPEGNKD